MAVYKHYPNQDKRYVVVYPKETITFYGDDEMESPSLEYQKMVAEVAAGTSSIEEVEDGY